MSNVVENGQIVVVGARGMLGRAWQSLLRDRQRTYLALDLPEFDLTERGVVSQDAGDSLASCFGE